MDTVSEIVGWFSSDASRVASAPLDPSNRIFVLYLASSVLAAFFIFRAARSQGGGRSFVRFLFPVHVWRHPSARLDLRYFVFHMLIGHFLMFGLTAWGTALAFEAVTGKPLVETILRESSAFSVADLAITLGYMMASAVVFDLTGFFIHYLQHKIPILWEFHKVHHSAEVMHPVSNYREHPVDNLVYKTATGLGAGAAAGVAVGLFGYTPSVPSLLGVPVIMFAFNMLAYNLRHSHIWLRWPGTWAMILPSPAHHHVHHSCHPDHVDKNFAFMFPVWDVIFGTYCMPADNRDVKFGIGEGKAAELNTCLRLYFVPFRDAWRLVRNDLRQNRRPSAAAPSELASAEISR